MKTPVSERARILIVRLSSMGDVIHAMPAVAALRNAHPKAHIGWAIEPAWTPLLQAGESHPLVDIVYRVPFKKWSRSLLSPPTLREMSATRRELRTARYDVALDMQGNLRSAMTLRWSQAPRLLGELHPREAIARLFSNERIAHAGVHIIDQGLELASAIFGDSLAYTAPPLPFDVQAAQWAEDILSQNPAGKYALLLPGAGWGAKRWPAERYGALAVALTRMGFRCFLNVGPGEESMVHTAQASSQSTATALATTLPQLIALLRRCSLCVGGDTGPLHLACALQVPTVGIYGPTDPARNGPYGAAHRVLRSPQSQRNHARRSAPEAGLLTISPEDVVTAIQDMFAKPDMLTEVQR